MSRILLDTNAYAHLLAGNDSIATEVAEAEQVYLSVFVLGELITGFRGGSKFDENRKILKAFLAKPTVKFLSAGSETAEIFGQIKNNLRKQGKPIPINNVWIAAHAMETGSVLISLDRHFNLIPGLRLWR